MLTKAGTDAAETRPNVSRSVSAFFSEPSSIISHWYRWLKDISSRPAWVALPTPEEVLGEPKKVQPSDQ
jgi:hypothetical protein